MGDQLAQVCLIEIVLKVKTKFEMLLKRHSIFSFITHLLIYVDMYSIFPVSQMRILVKRRAESFSVLFLLPPNPLFLLMILCNQG